MIETDELYDKLSRMSDEEAEAILDPICEAVRGKVDLDGVEVLANRIFALAVLDLYKKWQEELYFLD